MTAGFCVGWANLILTTLLFGKRLSFHVSLVFCCCDLRCREPLEHRQEACLLTQLSVYADFTSHPPAVLAALLSNPPLLPFHRPALLLLDKSLSPTTISTYLTSLSLLFLPAPAVHPAPCPFVSSTLTSLLNQLSFPSLFVKTLVDSQRSFRGCFWQPCVELIHELVLGQCNQPLFVAHYQLPGAELFTSAQ